MKWRIGKIVESEVILKRKQKRSEQQKKKSRAKKRKKIENVVKNSSVTKETQCQVISEQAMGEKNSKPSCITYEESVKRSKLVARRNLGKMSLLGKACQGRVDQISWHRPLTFDFASTWLTFDLSTCRDEKKSCFSKKKFFYRWNLKDTAHSQYYESF